MVLQAEVTDKPLSSCCSISCSHYSAVLFLSIVNSKLRSELYFTNWQKHVATRCGLGNAYVAKVRRLTIVDYQIRFKAYAFCAIDPKICGNRHHPFWLFLLLQQFTQVFSIFFVNRSSTPTSNRLKFTNRPFFSLS